MSTNTSSTSSGARAGKDTMGAIKSAATSLHGAGEAIRGNVNQAIDEAFNTHSNDAHNAHVANAGINELKTGNRGPTASAHATGLESGTGTAHHGISDSNTYNTPSTGTGTGTTDLGHTGVHQTGTVAPPPPPRY